MSIKRFNEHSLQHLRDVLEGYLATTAEETGLSIELGRCSFNANTATFKLEVKTIDVDGRAFDENAANFKVFAADFGLSPDDLGKTFVNNFTTFTICGLKPRNRKYPILASKPSGKVFKFTASVIQRLLYPDEPPQLTRYSSPINKRLN